MDTEHQQSLQDTPSHPGSPIPAGAHFAPVTPELLAVPGVTLAAVRVWSHVWLQTLGRPEWTLSHGQIGKATGLSKNSARRAVELLADAGWLMVEHRRDAAGDHAPSLILCAFPEGVCPSVGIPMVTTGHRGMPVDGHYQKSHLPEEETHAAPVVADSTEDAPAAEADASDWADWLHAHDPHGHDRALSLVAASLTADQLDAYDDTDTPTSEWDRLHEDVCTRLLAAYDQAADQAA